MEHIVPRRSYPTSKRHVPSLKSSHFLFVVFTMAVGFTVIIVGTSEVAHYIVPPPNPFLAYAEIFPGNPESALAGKGFTCLDKAKSYYYAYTEIQCVVSPADGDFVMIEVAVYSGIIHEISFLMRDSSLMLGDVVRLFNVSDFKSNAHGIVFSWEGSTGTAWSCPDIKGITLFCPVQRITFMLI